MMQLVQLRDPATPRRRVAMVDGNLLRLLRTYASVYAIARAAIDRQTSLEAALRDDLSDSTLSYEDIYRLQSPWSLLPAYDHPEEPARCLVTGTGLTHKASADNRQAMHANPQDISDSMRMYHWGLDGGQPAPGTIGVAPE